MMLPTFASRLLDWYACHERVLPWRESTNAYAVWVSEVMLQQTRVETAVPYYKNWMARFPTLERLAAASQQEVLAAWEGLGYYGRARNLHRAAQMVVSDFSGCIPDTVSQLRRLPGIGRYTAAAIASIAFGQDVPTLDGNIRRVLARVFDVTEDAHSAAGERWLWGLAAEHLPPGRAGVYNQALMDLGALVCTPRSPDCPACPVMDLCLAQQFGLQVQRPVLSSRPAAPHFMVTAAVIRRGSRVLIARRPDQGLLGGMWEFPGGKQRVGEDLPACLKREIREELGAEVAVGELLGVFRHAYSHFRITLHAFWCRLLGGEPQAVEAADLRWVLPGELVDYPMGKIDRQIATILKNMVTVEGDDA